MPSEASRYRQCVAAQRGRSAVAPDHRSILPNAAGFPWWAAIAVAVVATAIGVAFDAGSGEKELSSVFSALYVMGCLAAVLMVQQSAVFTAVIQPPLILFCTVPAAYWWFRGAGFPGLKAIAINCGYPLIERFPLMLFTAAAVLLIGMIRWYLGMLNGAAAPAADDEPANHRPTWLDKLGGMLTAALNRNPAHAIEPSASRSQRERRPGDRPRRATPEARRAARKATPGRSTARSGERRRGAEASAPARSRHIRPPMDDLPVTERPRRRRPAPEWADEPPRRRGEPAPRTQRDPRARSYRPAEAPESLPRRRPGTTAGRGNRTGSTHHPISRVRYRGSAGDEPGVEPRPRPRQPRNEELDSWEYDI